MSWCKFLLWLLLAMPVALCCACSSGPAVSKPAPVRPEASTGAEGTKTGTPPRTAAPVPDPRTEPRTPEEIYRQEVERRKAEKEWREMVRREGEKKPR
jgi:hypothetical protein